MAFPTKASENAAESTDSREESSDGPLMDSMSAAVKKMVGKAKERGYVTYDELNQVLPPDQMSSLALVAMRSLCPTNESVFRRGPRPLAGRRPS